MWMRGYQGISAGERTLPAAVPAEFFNAVNRVNLNNRM